ncbi:MAG: hypothetical protein Kow00105_02270 [Phycisphaeraceae bacterium]
MILKPCSNNLYPCGFAGIGRAFSLIELVLVMTIISVLAAIAVPRYANALSRYRADAAARRAIADLDYARRYAMNASQSVEVQINSSQDSIQIVGVQSLDDPAKPWLTDLSAEPYHADIVISSFPMGKVTFDGYGIPDTAGGFQVSSGQEARWIMLDKDTGKATIQ